MNQASLFERFIFAARIPILVVFSLLTVFLGWQASQLTFDSNLKKMVPLEHEWIQNLLKHKDDLGLGNDVQIAIEHVSGDIFDDNYLMVVKDITDEVFALEGVDPSKIKSLWTSNARWSEVTEDGFQGGEIIPVTYDGSPESLEELKVNVLRSPEVGRIVADNFKSSIVYVPLIEADENGEGGVDYQVFPKQLEEIRAKYQTDDIKIHIVGFSKKIGDLIEGIKQIFFFGVITLVLTLVLLYIDTLSIKGTLAVITCSLIAVIWQLGFLNLLHDALLWFRQTPQWPEVVAKYPSFAGLQFSLDPYAVLVPFLVFAIGVSHGVQILNAFANERSKGHDNLDAARQTFRILYIPGIIALISDAVGFITLWFIEIGVIRELAISASIGVAVIILTNLILVPVLLSWIGISQHSVNKATQKYKKDKTVLASFFSLFTRTPFAIASLLIALVGYGVGLYYSQNLKIGDLDKGAPELRPNSVYNQDVAFITDNYSVSADVLVVMVETPVEGCNSYGALETMDRFEWRMLNTPGVQSAVSLATATKTVLSKLNEGSLKWYALSRDQYALNNAMVNIPTSLYNLDCSLAPVFVFLDDHKAETLKRVTHAVESFAAENNQPGELEFVLASGNAGIEAATNQTIEASQWPMLLLVYSVVTFLVFLAFRSWRAVVCIILPLGLTSVLCQALMAYLGIGIKVSTLPVIALGVGIGVDYGIYIFSKFSHYLSEGQDLETAYRHTLLTTGKAVAFTGFTLAIGVLTWTFSPIKFQADMGLLLTFMFLWNMIGALWLIPAMSRFVMKPYQVLGS